MKKEDAVESIEKTGHQIHDLYMRAWSTALYPTQHGWGPAIGAMAAIPILNVAVLGHMVGKAIVDQTPPDVFEKIPTFGKSDKPNP